MLTLLCSLMVGYLWGFQLQNKNVFCRSRVPAFHWGADCSVTRDADSLNWLSGYCTLPPQQAVLKGVLHSRHRTLPRLYASGLEVANKGSLITASWSAAINFLRLLAQQADQAYSIRLSVYSGVVCERFRVVAPEKVHRRLGLP